MRGFFRRLRGGETPEAGTPRPRVTIVSGLPRSGTSMMMRVVEAAGIDVLSDEIRAADTDNPKGYYEFEQVKRLRDGDTTWVPDAGGRVVKVISALLEYLPASCDYRVLFVLRDLDEVLASQRRMLENRNEAQDVDEEELRNLYTEHLVHIRGWLAAQPNFDVLYVEHRRMVLSSEGAVSAIARFLETEDQLEEMIEAVDPSLYRQRAVAGST